MKRITKESTAWRAVARMIGEGERDSVRGLCYFISSLYLVLPRELSFAMSDRWATAADKLAVGPYLVLTRREMDYRKRAILLAQSDAEARDIRVMVATIFAEEAAAEERAANPRGAP